jgi:hypothetical protein
MTEKDPIVAFGTAEEVASVLLHQAFQYARQAASYEIASDLFSERIADIEPDPNWRRPAVPTTLADWMPRKEQVVDKALDPVTAQRMSEAWESSLRDAASSGRRFERKRQLHSLTDIVGHVVNLTLCLESVLNRQLFFLRESGELAPDHYKSIDRAELMPKLLFCFKEEILGKRLHVTRVRQLVSLRNNAVHYRLDSPAALTPSSEDLIEIWREFGGVLARTSGEPTQDDIGSYSREYVARWLNA